jgi:hypothetical protein
LDNFDDNDGNFDGSQEGNINQSGKDKAGKMRGGKAVRSSKDRLNF